MQARIVAYLNGSRVLCVPISAGATGIGRDADNAVQLSKPEVSKHHAVMEYTPKGWQIWDRNSRNGIFVNGSKITTAILKHGDEIKVGPYTLILEDDDDSTPKVSIDLSENASMPTFPAKR